MNAPTEAIGQNRDVKMFLKDFRKPLFSISSQRGQFGAWFIIVNFVGLAGFWLPLLFVWYRRVPICPVFEQLMTSGVLASFSVVILADGIASSLSSVGGSNPAAAGIRGLTGALALLLLIIQTVFLAVGLSAHDSEHPRYYIQIVFTAIAVLLSVYLYCFRFPEWEKDCGDVKTKEDKDIVKMKNAVKHQHDDGKGIPT